MQKVIVLPALFFVEILSALFFSRLARAHALSHSHLHFAISFSHFELSSFIDLKCDERMHYSIGGCCSNKFLILFLYIANKNLCMQTQTSLNPFATQLFFSASEWKILRLSILVSWRSDTLWYMVPAQIDLITSAMASSYLTENRAVHRTMATIIVIYISFSIILFQNLRFVPLPDFEIRLIQKLNR